MANCLTNSAFIWKRLELPRLTLLPKFGNRGSSRSHQQLYRAKWSEPLHRESSWLLEAKPRDVTH